MQTLRAYDLEVFVEWDAPGEDGLADQDFLDAFSDVLFERFEGDISPGIRAGHPYLSGTVEAPSLEEAVRLLTDAASELGLRTKRVQFYPDAVAPAA